MNKIADISKYQGTVDWGKAASELDFVILRASCGLVPDAKIELNMAGCTRYGIPFHVYHYLKALDTDAAQAEAETFYGAAKNSGALFYVIDCEYDGITALEKQHKGTAQTIVEAFIERLRLLGIEKGRIAIYIGHHLYKTWNLDYSDFAYVWIPRYGTNSGQPETMPAYACDLWQYTSAGRLAGVNGNVDLSITCGDKPVSYFTSSPEGAKPEGSEATMLTNLQFAQYCLAVFAAKWVYWYGTVGYACTTSLYTRKKAQYPKHYTTKRESGYKADIANGRMCADCVGLIKSFFWKGGDINGANKYASNGCPDKSADSLFAMCAEKGPIKSIPDIPGIVVHKPGHIGVYVGAGKTVEMKGFDSDCVKANVTEGPWTEWGKLPASMLAYVSGEVQQPSDYKLGDRVLSNGSTGSDVCELQRILVSLGYDLGAYGANKDGVDGSYGSKTVAAVKAYQTAKGIPASGEYDAATHEAMTGAATSPEPSQPQPEPTEPTGSKRIVTVKCNSGKVNIRQGDSTAYPSIKQVTDGTTFEYVATSPTGWHAIRHKNCIAWISPKYSTVSGE